MRLSANGSEVQHNKDVVTISGKFNILATLVTELYRY